jgi:hypothetical protein
MKTTELAKKALMACLVISAEAADIHSNLAVTGSKRRLSTARLASSSAPSTTRSGSRKTFKAAPRRRFSGELAMPTPAGACAFRRAALPTGNCDEMSSTWPALMRFSVLAARSMT